MARKNIWNATIPENLVLENIIENNVELAADEILSDIAIMHDSKPGEYVVLFWDHWVRAGVEVLSPAMEVDDLEGWATFYENEARLLRARLNET